MQKKQAIFLAGTFDGLHAGHKAILTRAFVEGKKVTIGLTSDQFVAKYKSQIPISNVQTNPCLAGRQAKSKIQKNIKSYIVRKRKIKAWLREHSFYQRATIIPIDDPYEPAASMPDLDALIVTSENRATGERINRLRQGSTLPSLTLIEVPMVKAEDGKSVSSTRLRNGEIDGNGRLIMPESMRMELGRPLGKVIKNWIPDRVGDDMTMITVGDIATKTLLDAGIIPKLAIIDGMVGRKPFHETLKILLPQKVSPFQAKTVKSGPGFISRKAMEAIQKILNSPSPPLILRGGMGGVTPRNVLLIDGEEDLLVLPAILHAPLGSILYYGQPGEGLVEVVVTEGKKQQALALLGKFT